MKNETSEHIRTAFLKWADDHGIDKASHEEWNKFLSIWNECFNYIEFGASVVLRHVAFGAGSGKTISAPAVCESCGTRHTAPTTGMVHDRCALCGGTLATEARNECLGYLEGE